MPLRRQIDLPSFSGVAAGQTATLTVPVQGTYYDLTLQYSESGALANQTNMETDITGIRMLINGTVVRRYTAETLIDLNTFYGVAFNTGFLPIFFAEPWARNAVSEDALAWGMNDVDSFQVEVDIVAGATSPVLSATATKTLAPRNLGPIKKISEYNVQVAGTGITNFPTLPRIDAYVALHGKSANIDDVRVLVDNVEIYKRTQEQSDQQLENQGLTPVSGYFHTHFGETLRIEDLLPMVASIDGRNQRVSDFQVDFNMASAANFKLISETVGLV